MLNGAWIMAEDGDIGDDWGFGIIENWSIVNLGGVLDTSAPLSATLRSDTVEMQCIERSRNNRMENLSPRRACP